MAKKTDKKINDALTLGKRNSPPKKISKDISRVEEATKEIHETVTPIQKEKQVEEVKKTSLHIPIELYKKLKREAFDRNVTLRKLIISTLEQKFK